MMRKAIGDLSSWESAVFKAIKSLTQGKGSRVFYRQELIRDYLSEIVREVEKDGWTAEKQTPEQTLSRILQKLRDYEMIEFLGRGEYKLLVE